MTKEEAIKVLEKVASIIDDPSIEMTGREWDEFDDLKRAVIPVAIEALKSERLKGEWIPNSPFTGLCSECGGNGNLKDNFCPNCGADMRGADNE